ncbi:elongator complex protein 1 isoform X2 [Prorops nasuta]
MKISPDHELFVFVTVEGTIIVMLSTFEIVSEVNLYSSDFGQKQFVTVGWGKKETQFHGSIGKTAALIQSEQITKNETDDGLPRITWRADGSSFAVSFLHPENQIRLFKIFNREGIVEYTSELASGLEEPISWKPNGDLIAVSQRLINKHVIALFEKNGLKHREFALPFETGEVLVKDLLWSTESEILAVWYKKNKNNTTYLQLWIERNYHWYLKQTFIFSEDNPLLYMSWNEDAVSEKELVLLTAKEILKFSFHWCVNRSKGMRKEDRAIIAVIDGNQLLLTNLKGGIVPPPMSEITVNAKKPINAIAFAPNINNEDINNINKDLFCCLFCDNKLAFFQSLNNTQHINYKCIQICDIDWSLQSSMFENEPCYIHHLYWLKKNVLLCAVVTENHNLLCVLNIEGILNEDNCRIVKTRAYPVMGPIHQILPSSNTDIIYVAVNNSIEKYFITDENNAPHLEFDLQPFTFHTEVTVIDSEDVIIALSYKNRLTVNGKEVANNISSFRVHNEFLLVTTLQHTLICVPLKKEAFKKLMQQDLTVKPWENVKLQKFSTDLNLRRVERGSYLVAVLPYDSKVILQMPRGNLETIQPRALSLHIIGMYLNNCDYLEAFDLMKKQRINLNLIYDHNPNLFIRNAVQFIESVNNPNWLSLFLSELQNEDITTTIYASSYSSPESAEKTTNLSIDKIEKVCSTMRKIMEESQEPNKWIQPILISLVKGQKVKGLEAALAKVKQLKYMEETKEKLECISSNEALKYLLYLVDVNVLFDISLGMYDLDLTMFVASKSQKDPKEYLPFLNELKKMDEVYMKYSIDIYLKRYENALEHIAKDPNKFDKCLTLICDRNLYRNGLNLFEKDSNEYKNIASAYGEYLLKNHKYQEAGIMFQRSNEFLNSMNSYILGGCWQDAVIIARTLNLSSKELEALYKKLAEKLKNDRRYLEASDIFLNYLDDPEAAIASLCFGKYWKNAIRIAYFKNRSDLLETLIFPSVIDQANYILGQLQKDRETFEKHKSRLSIVRVEMIKKKEEMVDCDEPNNELNDLLSDTTSIVGSSSSAKSRISSASRMSRLSKSRSKLEKKAISLKKGGVFEDLALIHALHDIITSTYTQMDEFKALTDMLCTFDKDDLVNKLQISMVQFLEIIENSKSEIWNQSILLNSTESTSFEMETDESIRKKLIEPHLLYPPKMNPRSKTWTLDIF